MCIYDEECAFIHVLCQFNICTLHSAFLFFSWLCIANYASIALLFSAAEFR